jgi:hypothetical protein
LGIASRRVFIPFTTASAYRPVGFSRYTKRHEHLRKEHGFQQGGHSFNVLTGMVDNTALLPTPLITDFAITFDVA